MSPRSATEFVLLTWRERKIYTIDRTTLDFIGQYTIPSQIIEGWGVTADESNVNSNGYYQLYVSDGSSYIYLVDGETLSIQSSIRVSDASGYIERINELEFANGYIYANVWYKDVLLKIDPSNGSVVKTYNIQTLENTEKTF